MGIGTSLFLKMESDILSKGSFALFGARPDSAALLKGLAETSIAKKGKI